MGLVMVMRVDMTRITGDLLNDIRQHLVTWPVAHDTYSGSAHLYPGITGTRIFRNVDENIEGQ